MSPAGRPRSGPRRRAGDVAVALDLVRRLGPRAAWTRHRQDRELRGLELGPSVYRRIWAEAAEAVGADLLEIAPDVLELRRGGRRTRVRDHHTTLNDALSSELSLDKPLVDRLLSESGLPVPARREFAAGDPEPALRFLIEADGPCVVKPARGTGAGAGVATGIERPDQLARAARKAGRWASRLLIERQAPGLVHRLLLLDGEVIDVIRRHPARVVGDGHSRVAELVAEENRRRLAAREDVRIPHLHLDLDALLTLEAAGLNPRSVPAPGRVVEVKTVTYENRVEDNETVFEPVHPDVAAVAIRAADVVGLRLAGIDVVTPDLRRPLEQAGGVIIEVNGPPGLHYHYQVADRTRATRVAIPILERALAG